MGWKKTHPNNPESKSGMWHCSKCDNTEFLVYQDESGKYIECSLCYAQTDEVFQENVNGKD